MPPPAKPFSVLIDEVVTENGDQFIVKTTDCNNVPGICCTICDTNIKADPEKRNDIKWNVIRHTETIMHKTKIKSSGFKQELNSPPPPPKNEKRGSINSHGMTPTVKKKPGPKPLGKKLPDMNPLGPGKKPPGLKPNVSKPNVTKLNVSEPPVPTASVPKNFCRRASKAKSFDDYDTTPSPRKRSRFAGPRPSVTKAVKPEVVELDRAIKEEVVTNGHNGTRDKATSLLVKQESSGGHSSGTSTNKSSGPSDIDNQIKLLTVKKLKAEINEKELQVKFYQDATNGFQTLIKKTDQVITALNGIKNFFKEQHVRKSRQPFIERPGQ